MQTTAATSVSPSQVSAHAAQAEADGGAETSVKSLKKNSCVLCAQRKVKCDRKDPCSACTKADARCIFAAPPTSRRYRKRYAEENVFTRLKRYEALLKSHGIEATLDGGGPSSEFDGNDTPFGTPVKSGEFGQSARGGSRDNNLWAGLSDELRSPAQQRLPTDSGDEKMPIPYQTHSDVNSPDASSLIFGTIPLNANLSSLHPRQLFRLWQTFLDNVNPLMKIVHGPTTQQRLVEASENLDDVPKGLEALMFAIYFFTVTSMTKSECETIFGESRSTVVVRFRNATQHALAGADFINTVDLDVLQAFVLFLLAIPDFQSIWVLTGIALRIAQRMELHRHCSYSKVSVFEAEIRRRLWWQIIFLDAKAAGARVGIAASVDSSDVKVPLNVNDSDLYPNMSEPPMEHTGTTEMIFCLIKYEVKEFLRKSPFASGLGGNIQKLGNHSLALAAKDKVIAELEAVFEHKYLRYCDPNIPLHAISIAMARLAICRLKFLAHHPRQFPDRGIGMSREENDMIFLNSVELVEYDGQIRKTRFVQHLLEHVSSKSQLDAFIFMVSELRRRTSGEIVNRAWKQVSEVFTNHSELITNTENALYLAIRELTLNAWEAKKAEMQNSQGEVQNPSTPEFIVALYSRKNKSANPPPMFAPGAILPDAGGPVPVPTSFEHVSDAERHQMTYFEPITDQSMNLPIAGVPPIDWAYWESIMQEQENFQAFSSQGQQFFDQS